MLDRFLAFNKPIQITEIATASEDGLDLNSMRPRSYAPPWHGTAWNPTLQADWTEAIYTLLYSKPLYTSVTWWDFVDTKGKFWPFGGLLDKDLKPKEAYLRIKKLQGEWGVAKKVV
jgi:endo-1,4-beta-xylanase